jgi:thiol:disulfide interchange protein DsbD
VLAASYSLGMALVYTALGVAAGLAGEGLAGALQKPWVLLTFGALLVALALSMFDVYQLQLPSAV